MRFSITYTISYRDREPDTRVEEDNFDSGGEDLTLCIRDGPTWARDYQRP